MVKEDKLEYKLEQLEEINQQGHSWKGIKTLKSKFSPKFCKFKDKDGTRIPVERYAEKAAEYLDEVQWKKATDLPEPKPRCSLFPQTINKIKDELFHIQELDHVIDKLKENKTPAPDETKAELIKWTDTYNRERLLISINEILEDNDKWDPDLNLANVASIYKKGDSSNLANYRPISLLQSFYKIIASLIKERIDAGIDFFISHTQYGLKQGKSTAQAIHLARRILDLSEREGSNLSMILLDWEKRLIKLTIADFWKHWKD